MKGVKQGCVLSPLLFILYIREMASMIENDKAGIDIHNVTISGLFYCDDLILIGRNMEELERLLERTQKMLDELGMRINCKKSNIMSSKNADKAGTVGESWTLRDTWGVSWESWKRKRITSTWESRSRWEEQEVSSWNTLRTC
jgi:hypothetical protein